MADVVVKNIEKPDETRKFAAHGWLDVVNLSDVAFGRATFQAGWRWSNDVKPIAGTDSCQTHHQGFVLSGRMQVRLDDGTEIEIGAGDVVEIPAGHDAWTLGDADCVMVDFARGAAANYAKPTT